MERVLKIAHVVSSLYIGGLEKVAVDVIHRLNKENVRSIVYCLNEINEYAGQLEGKGISVVLVKKKKYPLGLAFALAEQFRKQKIDIVQSHSVVYRDAALAGLLAKVPVIIHTDHGKFYPDKKWSKMNHWFFSNFRDRLIAVSDDVKNFLIEDVKIDSKKITRIYNGVDVSEHSVAIDIEDKKKKLDIPTGDKIIGVVARLAPVKDHATLFRAFKKVRKAFKNVKLLLVGNGYLKDALENLALELKEKENIIFLGKRTDVNELLHLMDIICLSSRSEGLSMTLTEAMASGKPVLATNVGGNPELIINGVSGLLVPAGDSDAMAEAIIKLLKDEAMRRKMGEEARKRIKDQFDICEKVKEHEKVYFDLAKQKGVT